jgi:hypothetical protein
MEVIDAADDRREQDAWLEELRAKYNGPPPIPLEAAEEQARRELGVEATAHHADYVYQEDGEVRLIPTTIVELPDGTSVQLFSKLPPKAAGRGSRG